MAPVTEKVKLPVAADFDAIQARIAVAFAQRENIVKSWASKSTAPRPREKTKEEIEAEKAEIYRPRTAQGVPIPEGGTDRKDIRGNDKLLQLISGKKGGHASIKSRTNCQISQKRGLAEEDSEEEEGRSTLGKGKKAKLQVELSKEGKRPAVHPMAQEEAKPKITVSAKDLKKGGLHVPNGSATSSPSKTSLETVSGVRAKPEIRKRMLEQEDSDAESRSSTASSKKNKPNAVSANINQHTEQPKNLSIASSALRQESIFDLPDDDAVETVLPARPISKLRNAPPTRPETDGANDSDASEMEVDIPNGISQDISVNLSPSGIATSGATKAEKLRERKKKQKKAAKERKKLANVMGASGT